MTRKSETACRTRSSRPVYANSPFPFDGVLRMVRDEEVVDSLTVVAVLLAARRRENRAG